jgi:predicted GTPase
VIVINKWDLVEQQVDKYLKKFKERETSPQYRKEMEEIEGDYKKTKSKKYGHRSPDGSLSEASLPKDRGANIQTAMNEYQKHIEKNLYFMKWAPVVFTCALDGKRVNKILDTVQFVLEERKKRVGTAELNQFLEDVVHHWQPPEKYAKEVKMYYVTQTDKNPPHFTLFTNLKDALPDDYIRYIMNSFRDAFGFIGTPITLNVRSKKKKKT